MWKGGGGEGPACGCNQPAVRRTVQKEGPNTVIIQCYGSICLCCSSNPTGWGLILPAIFLNGYIIKFFVLTTDLHIYGLIMYGDSLRKCTA